MIKKIPSSVVSVANNDIASSMEDSSTKTAFYKCSHWQRRTVLDGSGCILSHLSAIADIATTLCFMPLYSNSINSLLYYILVQFELYLV